MKSKYVHWILRNIPAAILLQINLAFILTASIYSLSWTRRLMVEMVQASWS